jgi:RNA polymerase sigma-70 factor (ECF subfamily)
MTEVDDPAVVSRCLAGDTEAFGLLVQKYTPPVFGVAFRITGNRQEAEDVTQTAFLKSFESLASYNPQYRFFSWLYRIAVNEALNAGRRRSAVETLDEDLPVDDLSPEQREREELLQKGLMELQPDSRAVVVLRHFEDLSYEEIAGVLEIPAKTVKSRLFTARTQLREILVHKGMEGNDSRRAG